MNQKLKKALITIGCVIATLLLAYYIQKTTDSPTLIVDWTPERVIVEKVDKEYLGSFTYGDLFKTTNGVIYNDFNFIYIPHYPFPTSNVIEKIQLETGTNIIGGLEYHLELGTSNDLKITIVYEKLTK